jgi:hypothetical protein
MRENIKSFGRAVIERVRDKAISVKLTRLRQRPHHPQEEWMNLLDENEPAQIAALERLVRLHTDQVIADFLGLFEDDLRFRVLIRSEDGQTFDAAQEGDDLSAAPFGARGWIASFSRFPPECE